MNDFLQQESLVLKFKKNGNELSKQKKNGNNEVALYFVRYVQLFFKIKKKRKKKRRSIEIHSILHLMCQIVIGT